MHCTRGKCAIYLCNEVDGEKTRIVCDEKIKRKDIVAFSSNSNLFYNNRCKRSGPFCDRAASNVEEELDNVAVLHDVLLAFGTDETLFLARGDRAVCDERLVRHDGGADEAALEIAVDLAGGLRRFRALGDRPCADLLGPRRQEADETEEPVARLDKLIETGFLDAHLFEERLLFIGIELSDLLLELGADGHRFRALGLCDLIERSHIVVRLAAEIVLTDVRNVDDRLRGQKEQLPDRFLLVLVRLERADGLAAFEMRVDALQKINLELIFADMETVEKRIDRQQKMAKSGDKKLLVEIDLLKRIYTHLESGKPVRTFEADKDEQEAIRGLFLLTSKPVIYFANVSEDDLGGEPNDYVKALYAIAKAEGAEAMTVCAKLEEEVAELDPDEKQAFLEEMGVKESGLDQLVKACYRLLGLISFLTAGPKEVRAWTITKGTKAPQAAGKIHSDFERGFIRAAVVPYETLVANGSIAACREKGLVRSEGKEYVMQDGDVVEFFFNV